MAFVTRIRDSIPAPQHPSPEILQILGNTECWRIKRFDRRGDQELVIERPVAILQGGKFLEYKGTAGSLSFEPDTHFENNGPRVGSVPYGDWRIATYYEKNKGFHLRVTLQQLSQTRTFWWGFQPRKGRIKISGFLRDINTELTMTLDKAIAGKGDVAWHGVNKQRLARAQQKQAQLVLGNNGPAS